MQTHFNASHGQPFGGPPTQQIVGGDSAGSAPIIGATCATCPVHAPAPARQRQAIGGFTLIELLAVVSMAGALTGVALPTFESQLQRTRRTDALVSMMQVQAAQERFRSNGARYGSLADIGTPGVSPAGHYNLQALSADEDGYIVLATATGTQARDANCRNLSLHMAGANISYASGPDTTVANPEPVNRKCWNL